MPRKRNPNGCPIEYARGLYQGEGTFVCGTSHRRRRAYPVVRIVMADREALEPLTPCFNSQPRPHGRPVRGIQYHVIERKGKAALGIAQNLATTTTRKQQIQTAMQKCRKLWQQGYHDRIP